MVGTETRRGPGADQSIPGPLGQRGGAHDDHHQCTGVAGNRHPPPPHLRGLRREGWQHLCRDGTAPRAREGERAFLPPAVNGGRDALRRAPLEDGGGALSLRLYAASRARGASGQRFQTFGQTKAPSSPIGYSYRLPSGRGFRAPAFIMPLVALVPTVRRGLSLCTPLHCAGSSMVRR